MFIVDKIIIDKVIDMVIDKVIDKVIDNIFAIDNLIVYNRVVDFFDNISSFQFWGNVI